MIEPTTRDIGRKVVYRWLCEPKVEEGVITSFTECSSAMARTWVQRRRGVKIYHGSMQEKVYESNRF